MKDAAEIAVVLDRSGSMDIIRTDAIGGFNRFLEDQKQVEGEAHLTLVLFDHEYEVVHDRVALADVPELTEQTYQPRGTTALDDAIGRTVETLGKQLETLPEDERPDKVLVVILTDGIENASTDYNTPKIKEILKRQQETYGWKVEYLAANVDAFAEGGMRGTTQANTHAFAATGQGVREAYAGASERAASYRTTGK